MTSRGVSVSSGRDRSGSLSKIDDFLKRKREEENIFQTSKLVARSPERNEPDKSDNNERVDGTTLSVVLEKLHEMTMEIRELKEAVKVEDLKEEIRNMREEFRQYRECMEEEKKSWESERESLEVKVRYMDSKINYLENQSRRDNLVFRGVPEKEGETWDDCVQKVIEVGNLIGVKVEKQNVLRAHRVAGQKRPRAIIAKMSSWKLKDEYMKKKKHLKGKSEVLVQEDFSRGTLEERRKLFEVAKKRKEEGEDAFVSFDKLFVKEGIFKWDSLKRELYKIGERWNKNVRGVSKN